MDGSKLQKQREKILRQKKDSEQEDYTYGKEFARGLAEGDVWVEFRISEKRFNELERQVRHAEIDCDSFGDFCKRVFPESKENQVKAFILCLQHEEWGKGEEEED